MTVGSLLILVFFLALFVMIFRTMSKATGNTNQQQASSRRSNVTAHQASQRCTHPNYRPLPVTEAALATVATSAILAASSRREASPLPMDDVPTEGEMFETLDIHHVTPIESTELAINPASGMPMMEGSMLDVAGNPYGFSGESSFIDHGSDHFNDGIDMFNDPTNMFGDW